MGVVRTLLLASMAWDICMRTGWLSITFSSLEEKGEKEETARLNILLILSYLIYLCSSGFLFDNDLISLGNEPFL